MPHVDSLPHARPTLLSYNVVCARLGISRQTFHNLADSGQLGPVYRVGILKKVTERGVEEYLRSVCDVEQAKPAAFEPKPKKATKKKMKKQGAAKAR